MTAFTLTNLHLVDRAQLREVVHTNLADTGVFGGVYILRRAENARTRPLSRLLADDPDWTLYVGRAGDLRERGVALIDSLKKPGSRAHPVGILLQQHASLAERFPLRDLSVEMRSCRNPGEAERQVLAAYLTEFGEGPPLNVRTR